MNGKKSQPTMQVRTIKFHSILNPVILRTPLFNHHMFMFSLRTKNYLLDFLKFNILKFISIRAFFSCYHLEQKKLEYSKRIVITYIIEYKLNTTI